MEKDALVVYYSLDGNTKFVAEEIAKESNGDLLRIEPVKEVPSNAVGKYVVGGFKALFKVEPELKDFNLDPNDYDLIYIGTPVWSGRMTPAIRSFLANVKLKDKAIRLFCTCRASEGKTITEMKEYLKNENEIIDELEAVTLRQNKAEIEQEIEEWVSAYN